MNKVFHAKYLETVVKFCFANAWLFKYFTNKLFFFQAHANYTGDYVNIPSTLPQ